MSGNFAIIGGDLRMVYLAKMLANEGKKVYTYGLEKAEGLNKVENLIECSQINQVVQESEIVIGAIPFSSDQKHINAPFSKQAIAIQEVIENSKNKMLIAGSIQPEMYEIANQQEIELIDIMKQEELAILNAVSTAEGAIEVAMHHTDKTLHGSKILILGFGRIGKVLAKKMDGLSAKITCVARKQEDLAWIKAYGYEAIQLDALAEEISQYDVIINTVPHVIMTSERLKYVDKETLLIDLASKPGGFDEEAIKKKNLKLVWALALPGKVAPFTTAEIIKDTIYHILKEKKEKC